MTIYETYKILANILNYFYSENNELKFYPTIVKLENKNQAILGIYCDEIIEILDEEQEELIPMSVPEYKFISIINPKNINKELSKKDIISIFSSNSYEFPAIKDLITIIENYKKQDNSLEEMIEEHLNNKSKYKIRTINGLH